MMRHGDSRHPGGLSLVRCEILIHEGMQILKAVAKIIPTERALDQPIFSIFPSHSYESRPVTRLHPILCLRSSCESPLIIEIMNTIITLLPFQTDLSLIRPFAICQKSAKRNIGSYAGIAFKSLLIIGDKWICEIRIATK